MKTKLYIFLFMALFFSSLSYAALYQNTCWELTNGRVCFNGTTGRIIQGINISCSNIIGASYNVCAGDGVGGGGGSGVNYWQTLGTTLTPNSSATGGIYKLNASLGCGNITGTASDLCTITSVAGNSSWNQSLASILYAPISIVPDNSSWNESFARTLFANINIIPDNSSWNESKARSIFTSDNSSWNQTIATTLFYPLYSNPTNFISFDNYLGNQSVNNQSLLAYMASFATHANVQGNASNLTTWGLGTFQLKVDTVTNISNFATKANVQDNATALLTNGTLQTTNNLVTNLSNYLKNSTSVNFINVNITTNLTYNNTCFTYGNSTPCIISVCGANQVILCG